MNPVLEHALHDFRRLLTVLDSLREDQLLEMLDHERSRDDPRKTVVERLHQKYCSLRMRRERAELMKGLI